MRVYFSYKKYTGAPLATVVSFIGGIFLALGLCLTIYGVVGVITTTDAAVRDDNGVWAVFGIAALLIAGVIKLLAKLLAWIKYQLIKSMRGDVKYQHIYPTRMDKGEIFFNCPKCGFEVSESVQACPSCGCRSWHRDALYKKDLCDIKEDTAIRAKLTQNQVAWSQGLLQNGEIQNIS